jgi:hypothetical protein
MMGNYHVRFGGQGNHSTDPTIYIKYYIQKFRISNYRRINLLLIRRIKFLFYFIRYRFIVR